MALLYTVALSSDTIPSFVVLHIEKLAFQCAKLRIGSRDNIMNLCGDFFFFFLVSVSVP